MVVHTFNPWKSRAKDLCEFKATVGCTRLTLSKERQNQGVKAHTFNPRIWEVEKRSDMAGQREEYKAGGDRSSGFSLRFHRDRITPLA